MDFAVSDLRRPARVPAPAWFLVSAVFHYLGPSLAVLLFEKIDILGVAWLRIASAAAVFLIWRGPKRIFGINRRAWTTVAALGVTLACMNAVFYLAVARLPLSTVGAIEFLGTVLVAAYGSRTKRNLAAVGVTALGVAAITQIRVAGEPLGFAFAFANCALFVFYIVIGHRIANEDAGIDRLAGAMFVATIAIAPLGFRPALPAFSHLPLLAAGAGVGVCSSVIPYVTDQLAMAQLSRSTFALMLATLPAFATIIGALVLRQIPTPLDLAGIGLVVAGVALHREGTK